MYYCIAFLETDIFFLLTKLQVIVESLVKRNDYIFRRFWVKLYNIVLGISSVSHKIIDHIRKVIKWP